MQMTAHQLQHHVTRTRARGVAVRHVAKRTHAGVDRGGCNPPRPTGVVLSQR